MLFTADVTKIFSEGIIFLAYVLTCARLTECRFGKRVGIIAAGGILAGIALLQAALILSGQNITFLLTLLPVTAYLPAAIGLFVLSRSDFLQTTAVWMMGILVSYILKVLDKIVSWYFELILQAPGWKKDIWSAVILLFAAGLLLFYVFRFVYGLFQAYVKENRTNWMHIFFPILMIFLLFSYFRNTRMDITVWFLLFLTAISIFLIVARLLVSSAAVIRMKESEEAVKFRIQMQRQEYEDISKKIEAGRIYRHDMRHHLAALEELVKQDNKENVLEYLEKMGVSLSNTEQEIYCENVTINAVLSSCIRRAKNAGCDVTANIQLPKENPFDDMDVSMVLANAIENAMNACEKISEQQKRYIRISAEFLDQKKLIISIKNSCEGIVPVNSDGYPDVPKSDGHGIGLKSIAAITEKYKGCFRCECIEGQFRFYAVMFCVRMPKVLLEQKKESFWKKHSFIVSVSIAVILIAICCVPVAIQIVTKPYGSKNSIQTAGWGDSGYKAEYPEFVEDDTEDENQETNGNAKAVSDEFTQEPLKDYEEETADGVADVENGTDNADYVDSSDIAASAGDLNDRIDIYLDEIKSKYLWYVSRKYEGYAAADTGYQILRNDDDLLVIQLYSTINTGGSVQYSRNFILEKESGEILELRDLFLENSDYCAIISQDILRQMAEQVQSDEASYFIPGGIWAEEECFKEIVPDQNFYINEQNKLVIVFEEYEVAPGSMGMPEFVIDTGILSEIIKEPSILH